MDPEGISFQSAMADLKDVAINRPTTRPDPHPLQIIDNFFFQLFLILILLCRWLYSDRSFLRAAGRDCSAILPIELSIADFDIKNAVIRFQTGHFADVTVLFR